MRGYGHTPLLFTAGFDDEDPIAAHRRFAEVLDEALTMIADIKRRAREDAAAGRPTPRPAWPMIIFRTDRKSTRLNSSHVAISYAVFCLKKTSAPPPRRCRNSA